MELKAAVCIDDLNITIKLLNNLLRYQDISAVHFLIHRYRSPLEIENVSEFLQTNDIVFIDSIFQKTLLPGLSKNTSSCLFIFFSKKTVPSSTGFSYEQPIHMSRSASYDSFQKCLDMMLLNRSDFFIEIPSGLTPLGIDWRSIAYIETSLTHRNYIHVHTLFETLKARSTILEAQKILPVSNFICPSRGYLVNVAYITAIDNDTVKISGSVEIPVSRRKKTEIQNLLKQLHSSTA